MCGSFFTGIFASASVSALDGFPTLAPGDIDGNATQVGEQLAELTALLVYNFTVSCALLYILKLIPGKHLRVSEEGETVGLDQNQLFDDRIGERDLAPFRGTPGWPSS